MEWLSLLITDVIFDSTSLVNWGACTGIETGGRVGSVFSLGDLLLARGMMSFSLKVEVIGINWLGCWIIDFCSLISSRDLTWMAAIFSKEAIRAEH